MFRNFYLKRCVRKTSRRKVSRPQYESAPLLICHLVVRLGTYVECRVVENLVWNADRSIAVVAADADDAVHFMLQPDHNLTTEQ